MEDSNPSTLAESNDTENKEANKDEIEVSGTQQKDSDDLNKTENDGETKSDETSNYDPKNVYYEGDVAIYRDPKTGYQYKWDKDKSEWTPHSSAGVSYSFEDDTHTYTDAEGAKYFWDKEKNAWIPKIDDDFMARYQMNYGFIDNTTKEEAVVKPQQSVVEKRQPEKLDKGVKRKPSEPSWFEQDETQSTKVYVSNLPLNTTEEEFIELMQKCGIIKRDFDSNKLKIKLYMEPGSNEIKGDGLCTYVRKESVDLALKLIDGCDFKGKKVKVERAKFQLKGDYNPNLKPKSKKRKEKQKLQRKQEKLFDWRPEKMIGERAKHERIVICKNVFEPKIFDDNVSLILELQDDLRKEGAKCGTVRKVIIYDRHPDGVAQINFTEAEEADACVEALNGRWFAQRQISAELWDGRTKFKIAETDAEITQRIGKWDKYLTGDEKADKT